MRILVLCYAFPPLAYPEAIVAAKALVAFPGEVHVVAMDPSMRPGQDDESLLEYVEDGLWRIDRLSGRFTRLAFRHQDRIPAVLDLPDAAATINGRAFEHVRSLDLASYDCLISRSQFHSVHLAALRLHRAVAHLPWIAQFSDPWTDNPFFDPAWPAKGINLRLERRVLAAADRLVFTSREMADLVLSGHPASWRERTRVIPHAFDETLYPASRHDSSRLRQQLVVRHVGNFYGARSPQPLVQGLQRLASAGGIPGTPPVLELVGAREPAMLETRARRDDFSIRERGPVNYLESLRLMSSADLLVAVDAPAAESPFLPSKLIDYIGAGRPIVALTPPGAASRVVEELGGWCADPADPEACARALAHGLAAADTPTPWGNPAVRARYQAPVIGEKLAAVVAEVGAAQAGQAAGATR